MRNDREVMGKRTKCTPTERAAEYLERIAALTGAKPDGHGKYRLKAGRMQFLGDSEFVPPLVHEFLLSRVFNALCRMIPHS